MSISSDNEKATARAFYAAFVSKQRDNGETYFYLRDGSPEWMRDAIFEAHQAVGEGMQDEVYEACRDAAEHLADCDDWDDGAHEFADGAVSVYDAERVAWLSGHSTARGAMVDEACKEFGIASTATLSDRIAAGWYEWNRLIYEAVRSACEEAADDAEDEEF